jgi:putative peptide zinc metalloprotease protein
VQTRRQRFRGRDWWIVEDPASNQYFRMNRPAYRFVGLLDGRRTVGAVWESCVRSMGDEAPTQGEAIQLLGQLYSSNLLSTAPASAGEAGGLWAEGASDGLTPDAEEMFRRQRRRAVLDTQNRLSSFLSLRIPLYDPDRLLGLLATLIGWLFSAWGMALWLILIGIGLATLAGRWDALIAAAGSALSARNLPWLYAGFVLSKLVHEAAHGVACKVFGRREGSGGEVHAVGIMLLVLLPAPYVDATSAWGLRSKWRRIIIGAAGMMAEVALATIAALVWSRTAEGSSINILAANVILIAGVSTILFNANPLLRYDGYYILSDLLEMPNLQQRSREYLRNLVKSHIWGVRLKSQVERSPWERWLLATFGVASTAYLLFVTVAITLYVAEQWFFVGALMAAAAAILWFVAPLVRLLRYLTTDQELARTRSRAAWTTIGAAALLLLAVGVAPAPRSVRVVGVVESEHRADVRMGSEGFITWAAPSGARIEPGANLVKAENRDIQVELAALDARLEGFEARRRQALAQRPAEAAIESERIAAVLSQRARVAELLSNLQVPAPVAGVWAPDESALVNGRFARRGERLGAIVDTESVVLRAAAGQDTAAILLEASDPRVIARIAGRPDSAIECRIERVVEAGRRDLPSESLGISAGGEVAERAGAESAEAAERFFEIAMRPSEAGAEGLAGFLPGQRFVARISLAPEPIGWQALRWARQAIQRRFGV